MSSERYTLVERLGAGVHDISEEWYHADPCPAPSLSRSVAKLLIDRSPAHAKAAHPRLNPEHREEGAARFDLGSAFHTLFLRSGAEVVAIEADSYRTKLAKEQRDAARAAGKIPLLAGQLERARSMVEAVQAQVIMHPEAAKAFVHGLPEQSLIWQEDNGIWCRARLDWLPAEGCSAHPDLKSTEGSAGPSSWGRSQLFTMGYDLQDAFYRRGLKRLKLADDEAYLLFLVAETEPPHLMATHRCSPSAAALADRKIDAAIQLWGWCLEHDSWPGYRPETAWHDAPPWQEEQWYDIEASARHIMAGA